MRKSIAALGWPARLLVLMLLVVAMTLAGVIVGRRALPTPAQRYVRDRATVMEDQLKDWGPLRWAATKVGLAAPMPDIGDGEPPTGASLHDPTGVVVGPDGALYVSERRGHRVRVVRDDLIETLAGNGRQGFAGEGMQATLARLNRPEGLALDSAGNLYVTDSFNHRIRRIGRDGRIVTVAGTGAAGHAGDGGPATAARLNAPMDVKIGPDGSLYIVERDNHAVRRVGPDGTITTVVGTGESGFAGDGGPATQATLAGPYGLEVGPDGTIYIADSGNNRVRKVAPDGTITTIAGTGRRGYAGDGGPARDALFDSPQAVVLLTDGRLIVNDEHNHVLRVIRPDGTIHTIAGTGEPGFSGDGGAATAANLHDPEYLFGDPAGRIVFTDGDNGRVRAIGTDGRIRTIAGNGWGVPSGD